MTRTPCPGCCPERGGVGPNPANDRLHVATYRAMREIMSGVGEVLSADGMIGRAAQLVALADAVRADPGEWSHAEVLELAAECGERTSRKPSSIARTAELARLLAFDLAHQGPSEAALDALQRFLAAERGDS